MNPGSSTESYPAFAHIGLRESPGKTSTRPEARSHLPQAISRLCVGTLVDHFPRQAIERMTPGGETQYEKQLRMSPNTSDLTPPDFFVQGSGSQLRPRCRHQALPARPPGKGKS
ncbi:hypothetical protein ANN_07676 [Periplaneta americana]|uniref:Uncharacterized protein n=1 Tax=Periplaneta americana TaxID=6978 RepID=A0ABQ8T0V3_PERAM|nr:hypothetical protein ANN_07676 [Periplaneta americana]